MKKISLFLIALIISAITWMGFQRVDLPPVPEICAEISGEVNLSFVIDKMDYSSLEFALDEKAKGKAMFIEFKMANAFKTGRPGLVLAGIRQERRMKNGMSPQTYRNDAKRKGKKEKDFSIFMKDKKGKAISRYTFKQTLVEGRDGRNYMKMSYSGPAMTMIQTMEIPRPVTLPAHISRRFIPKGTIQFLPGTVAFDTKINGFLIPVRM